jgi:methyltransferase (TIGR00027 family)
MNESLVKDVSDTAFWIAEHRAVETKRRDALFRDPLASHLGGERGRRLAKAMPMSHILAWTVAIRTRIIDDFINMAVGAGVDTVLNLGAGLDTRPYRMKLPTSLCWIEADHPRLIEYKQIRLRDRTPLFRTERIKIDLADVSKRQQLLAKTNERATKLLILTEGLVPYLTMEEVASLADDLRTLDRAAYWIVDYFAADVMKYRDRQGMKQAMQNAPFKFLPEDWFGFFQEHGWKAGPIRYLVDEAERLNRPFPAPLLAKIAIKLLGPFASKKRRDAWRNFAGYVMLEPF